MVEFSVPEVSFSKLGTMPVLPHRRSDRRHRYMVRTEGDWSTYNIAPLIQGVQ